MDYPLEERCKKAIINVQCMENKCTKTGCTEDNDYVFDRWIKEGIEFLKLICLAHKIGLKAN